MDRRYKKRIDRYWAKMEKKGINVFSRLDPNGWFDLWHTHPDWKGKGNKCVENRQSAIELGYKILKQAERFCDNASIPIQCWATFCENTFDNAVYLHSENPNPNGAPFPYAFEGCEWESAENPLLNQSVDKETHRIGKIQYGQDVVFIVKKRS